MSRIGPFIESALSSGASPGIITWGVNGLSTAAETTYMAGWMVTVERDLALPTLEAGIGAAVLSNSSSGKGLFGPALSQ